MNQHGAVGGAVVGVAMGRFDVRSADGTSLGSGWTAPDRRWCWSTVRFAIHRVRPVGRGCAPARPRTRWIVEALVSAVTQPAMPSSVSSRTSQRSWMPSPLAPAARLCVWPFLRSQLRDGRRRPHQHRRPSRVVRTEPRHLPGWSIEAVEAAIAGDVESAVVAILVGILEMTEAEVDDLRLTPQWPALLAAGPTVSRECRVENGWSYQPGQFGAISGDGPVGGARQPAQPWRGDPPRRSAIPGARIRVLDGHGHFAHKTDPAMVASIIQQLISS